MRIISFYSGYGETSDGFEDILVQLLNHSSTKMSRRGTLDFSFGRSF